MIINLRTAGSQINIYVVKGVLADLITKYRAFLDLLRGLGCGRFMDE